MNDEQSGGIVATFKRTETNGRWKWDRAPGKPPGKVCVYAHLADGVVFYVGRGLPARPFNRTQRNRKWKAIVDAAGSYKVQILGWYATDKEAEKREAKEIDDRRPMANLEHVVGGSRSIRPLSFRVTDAEMALIAPAARRAGLSLGQFARAAVRAALSSGITGEELSARAAAALAAAAAPAPEPTPAPPRARPEAPPDDQPIRDLEIVYD